MRTLGDTLSPVHHTDKISSLVVVSNRGLRSQTWLEVSNGSCRSKSLLLKGNLTYGACLTRRKDRSYTDDFALSDLNRHSIALRGQRGRATITRIDDTDRTSRLERQLSAISEGYEVERRDSLLVAFLWIYVR